jgi:TonB family protein
LAIPLPTADSNKAVKGNGAVDLAGLIVDDSQEGEARAIIEIEKPPASAHASPTDTSSITSVVIPDDGKSISTMSRKFGAPAVQHDIQLSKDVSFGVHLSPEPSKRSGIFTVVAALIVISVAGAGAYWWYFLRGAATHAPTASVAAATDSSQPAANPPATLPAEIVPQNNPAAAAKTQSAPSTQNAPVKKNNANPGNGSQAAPNTRAAAPPSTVNEDAPAPARKPNVISSKMAAPRTPSGNSGNSVSLTAPDLSAPNSRPISTTPLLGGMNSLPTPPPAPVAVTPAPTAASTAPVASDIIKQPKLLSSVTAIYPKMAQLRGDFGVVTVDALVNETGRVTSAKAISGPSSLRQSAIDAVMQQRYSPATINGRPAATHVTVNVEYKRKQ